MISGHDFICIILSFKMFLVKIIHMLTINFMFVKSFLIPCDLFQSISRPAAIISSWNLPSLSSWGFFSSLFCRISFPKYHGFLFFYSIILVDHKFQELIEKVKGSNFLRTCAISVGYKMIEFEIVSL